MALSQAAIREVGVDRKLLVVAFLAVCLAGGVIAALTRGDVSSPFFSTALLLVVVVGTLAAFPRTISETARLFPTPDLQVKVMATVARRTRFRLQIDCSGAVVAPSGLLRLFGPQHRRWADVRFLVCTPDSVFVQLGAQGLLIPARVFGHQREFDDFAQQVSRQVSPARMRDAQNPRLKAPSMKVGLLRQMLFVGVGGAVVFAVSLVVVGVQQLTR